MIDDVARNKIALQSLPRHSYLTVLSASPGFFLLFLRYLSNHKYVSTSGLVWLSGYAVLVYNEYLR